MAEKILNTRIQLKYDTLANWNKSSLLLKAGEVAIATVPTVEGSTVQPVMIKIGNGSKTFSQLDWVSAKAADVYGWAKTKAPVLNGQVIEFKDATGNVVHSIDLSTFVTSSELTTILNGYQPKGNYKTVQTAVENKITDKVHVLSSLTQSTNGEISYEVKKLTPNDIGAQPAGDYQPAGNYKTIQEAITEKGAANQTLKISQNENGVITATPVGIAITASQVTDFSTEVAKIKVNSATIADKVSNKLTVGTKTFDGSDAVEVTAADLGLESAMHFIGAVTEAPADPKAGDVYLNTTTKKEYVYDTTNGWVELGDEGSYALRNITITANEGLTGGGDLTANRTIGIANNGVTTAKIADKAVTEAKLADAVTTKLNKQGQPIGNYKTIQSAVNDPAANGKSLTFIDTISQNANGVITATKKNVNLDNYALKSEIPTDFGVTKITSTDTTTSNKDDNVSGLKITPATGTGSVNIEIDDTVTFIFDCGGAN